MSGHVFIGLQKIEKFWSLSLNETKNSTIVIYYMTQRMAFLGIFCLIIIVSLYIIIIISNKEGFDEICDSSSKIPAVDSLKSSVIIFYYDFSVVPFKFELNKLNKSLYLCLVCYQIDIQRSTKSGHMLLMHILHGFWIFLLHFIYACLNSNWNCAAVHWRSAGGLYACAFWFDLLVI